MFFNMFSNLKTNISQTCPVSQALPGVDACASNGCCYVDAVFRKRRRTGPLGVVGSPDVTGFTWQGLARLKYAIWIYLMLWYRWPINFDLWTMMMLWCSIVKKNERLASDKLRRRYGDPWVSHSGNEVQIVDCQDLFEFTRYVNQPTWMISAAHT